MSGRGINVGAGLGSVWEVSTAGLDRLLVPIRDNSHGRSVRCWSGQMITLEQILGLVGVLDDRPGDDTPRERFRKYLETSVNSVGAVRDYIEACTRNKGTQYDHALQDLVNHAGRLIGFEVEYGRYKGIANEIGYDGLWRRNGFSIVIEVKTTDAFSIQTATVIGYVDRLISAGEIRNWDHAMGLYVFGRTDSELKQLQNSIIAEKRTHQLRIATVDDILSLAELVQDNFITAEEAVALLRPAGVFVADTVRLLARIAAKTVDRPVTPVERGDVDKPINTESETQQDVNPPSISQEASERLHLLTPVRDDQDRTARDIICDLLGSGWYVFGESTTGRKRLKPGDRICFYETGVGIVAEATVASHPERKPPATKVAVINKERFPWSFRVRDVRFFFESPIVIDSDLRAKLVAFRNRNPESPWSWFVQSTRIVTEHDFEILVGKEPPTD